MNKVSEKEITIGTKTMTKDQLIRKLQKNSSENISKLIEIYGKKEEHYKFLDKFYYCAEDLCDGLIHILKSQRPKKEMERFVEDFSVLYISHPLWDGISKHGEYKNPTNLNRLFKLLNDIYRLLPDSNDRGNIIVDGLLKLFLLLKKVYKSSDYQKRYDKHELIDLHFYSQKQDIDSYLD